MKKLISAAIVILMLAVFTACGKTETPAPTPSPTPLVLITPEPTPTVEQLYSDVLVENMHDGVGVYYEDIDGNGITELFIGPTTGDIYEKQVISAMYTLTDNVPVKVFESNDKEKYYICDNGTIALESISNAYMSCYTFYSYSNGELYKMMAIGIDMQENPEMPWYKEEGDTRTSLEETDAINTIQAYQSTYRNLNFS